MEEESEPKQSTWANIPEVCLRHIFQCLDDKDRAQAAMVCKKWSNAMNSGSLWRSRTITFHGNPSEAHKLKFQSALWYTKKYGKYLEALEISIVNLCSSNATQKFQRTMSNLFSHLRKCNHRLAFLTIRYLELDRAIWRNRFRRSFIKTLAFFLKKMSKHLDYLNLKEARLSLEDGCELLDSLSYLTNKSSVTEINIEDFFHTHLPVYRSTIFHQTMSKFCSLVVLTFNYNCISDELLNALRVHCAHSLSTLNIKCHIHDPHQQVVRGMSWGNLAKRVPKLKVNFHFERVLKYSRLARILQVEIPVSSIRLRSSCFSDPEWTIRPTLTILLPFYQHVLQRLILKLNNGHEVLDNELLQLVLSCKRLLFLKVWAFLSVTFMERLLQNRAERKCILTTIQFRIYTAQERASREHQLLSEISRKYKELIDSELDYFAVIYPTV
ncbi:FBX39 protein, partial [Crotophaga sulcirostris]|nr:FBX39 protein [Crotophaga sulcirostris]